MIQDWFRENSTSSRGAGVSRQPKLRCDLNRARAATTASSVCRLMAVPRRRHKLSGHLFAGRYKSLLVDGATPGYLRAVCDYVHLNPVRARLLGKRERLQKYRWSSYPSYWRGRQKREPWLRCDRLLGEHGLRKESRRSRLEFARRMEHRRVEPNDPSTQQIRRGWSFGAEDFIARLLDRMPGSVSEPTMHANGAKPMNRGRRPLSQLG